MQKLSVENSIFLPQVVQLIQEGHKATIIARGNSMRPFIEDGRDKLVFGKVDNLKVGDVILAEVEEGHFVCHRIEAINDGIVTMTSGLVYSISCVQNHSWINCKTISSLNFTISNFANFLRICAWPFFIIK